MFVRKFIFGMLHMLKDTRNALPVLVYQRAVTPCSYLKLSGRWVVAEICSSEWAAHFSTLKQQNGDRSGHLALLKCNYTLLKIVDKAAQP